MNVVISKQSKEFSFFKNYSQIEVKISRTTYVYYIFDFKFLVLKIQILILNKLQTSISSRSVWNFRGHLVTK